MLPRSCNVCSGLGFLSCSKLLKYKREERLTSVELLNMIMAWPDQTRQNSHYVICHGPGAKDTATRLHNSLADSLAPASVHETMRRSGWDAQLMLLSPCLPLIDDLCGTCKTKDAIQAVYSKKHCLHGHDCTTSKSEDTCSAARALILPLTVHPPRSGLPHSQGKCPVQEGPAPPQIPAHHVCDPTILLQGKGNDTANAVACLFHARAIALCKMCMCMS